MHELYGIAHFVARSKSPMMNRTECVVRTSLFRLLGYSIRNWAIAIANKQTIYFWHKFAKLKNNNRFVFLFLCYCACPLRSIDIVLTLSRTHNAHNWSLAFSGLFFGSYGASDNLILFFVQFFLCVRFFFLYSCSNFQ